MFFALWPPPDAAAALHAIARTQSRQSAGFVTRPDCIHLTLVFLGDVPAARVEALRAPPPAIAGPPFDLCLDRFGHWVRNGIAWTAPSIVPDALTALQSRLADWASAQGVPVDTRPFRPHVTLLRRAARFVPEDPVQPMAWRVREYALVRSHNGQNGARYETIGRYPLNHAAVAPS
jgi:2'-5' RNA ligase